MSRPIFIAAATRAATASGVNSRPTPRGDGKSETLLPPAIKGITLGFVAGLVAILCLMLLAPSLVNAEQGSNIENPTGIKH